MLARIAAFEVRYQLRAPLFAVGFALFFLLTFGSVTMDEIQIGGKGNVNVNSPFAIAQTVGVMGVFAVFIVTAFVSNVIVRDDETGFAPLLQATRITKLDYLVGRFAGAALVAFLVLSSVALGMLVGSWMPWLDPEKVGPFVAGHYLYALFVIGLPTLLVMAAGFFALATVTRSMMWTYVGLVAFLVLFTTSRVLMRDPAYDAIASLTDPFGMSALTRMTRYWTATERNTMLPPISGLMLYNRLIWVSVGAVLFLLAYWRFRFGTQGAAISMASAKALDEGGRPAPVPRAVSAPRAGPATSRSQFGALTRFDMRFVFRSPAFFVLLAVGMFNAFGGMAGSTTLRGVDYFPVTRAMVEVLQGSFSIIPIIIAIYYAGELVWRDHDRRMHEIVGASAAPDWAFVVPKILAIAGVLVSTYVAGILVGVGFQLWHGYTRLEIGHYLLWFALPGVIAALQMAALSVFIQVLVPHKFMGWAVMLVYLVATISLAAAGFEHNLYSYAGVPPAPLSDMNGLGRFWIGQAWFQAYWLAFGFVLVVLSHCLWRRGTEMRLAPRLARLGTRLRGASGAALAIGLAGFAGTGAFIFHNTNGLNRYMTGPQREEAMAEYEKTLLAYEKVPQPRITDVKLAVDLYPREVRALTRGEYAIENRTDAALPVVHVRWNPDSRLAMTELAVEGAKLEKEYADLHYRIYRFEVPMQPGERRTVRFASTLEERGFPNARPLTRIVANGTFLNNFEVAPLLGMDHAMLLTDRAKRRKYGLPPELRPAKLEDEGARANNYIRHDSDWVKADLTVSTDADQIPVAPGYALSDETANGRRTLHTRTEAPIMHFFSMQSAKYAVKADVWKPAAGESVALAVYHHPEHGHNAQLMNDAMKASFAVFTRAFSPYQFRQARILEFPGYESFAQSFANTVPYSETIGFIQNHPAKTADGDEKIDLVTYVTAHEIAHQWWAHQVIGADKQGMTMLSESFAQYSAMLVMEKLYGPEMMRKFLKYELDGYLRARGGEVVEELPLVRVENQGYVHYRKGALVMYWLKEAVGEEAVDRALRRLIAQYAFKPAPYPSSSEFVRMLREEAGPQHEALISDLFEKITLYDMKAKDATWKKRGDGRYEVSFSVEGRKLYADGQGKETQAPLSEPFEIGVFTAQPGKKGFSKASVLLVERRTVVSGTAKIDLVVDQQPKWVGVDPFNKRIDRNSDDNLTEVKPAS
ncbi:MAG: aminopeptidase [Betaproteobacteria bacterium]|nr:aminopeptidase [Betaproteobacteria bacterium]